MSDRERISGVFRSTFPEAETTGFRTDAWREGVAGSAAELKPLHATVLHAFALAAKADATTGITLVADDEAAAERHLPYRALYHEAMRTAGALLEAGVRTGDRVLIVLPTSHEFVIAFFAVQLAGAIPVPSYPPAVLERAEPAIERLGGIARQAGATCAITSRRLFPLLGELTRAGVGDLLTIEALASAGDPARVPRPRAAAGDVAFLQFTSGSTGSPRGVAISHGAAVANMHASGQALRFNRRDVMVSWLPLYHDMGLIGGLLISIYWRLPLVMLSPMAFLARPVRWLRAIQRHAGTVSPAPNFAYALCTRRIGNDERRGLDLSSWRLALNGAEPVQAATIEEFVRVYEPHGFRREAVLPVYGLAEITLAAAFPPPGRPPHYLTIDRDALGRGEALTGQGEAALTFTSVGRAIPGHRVAIVDEQGRDLPERRVGHIVVGGPSLMREYHADPTATALVMRDGALWTGDLGFVAGGELYVTGRVKDVIIVNGRNHHAEDLERVAAAVAGVRQGGVVAFGTTDDATGSERVVLVCETRVIDDVDRDALAVRVADEVLRVCSVPVDEVVLADPGTIPKTPSGKPQRGLTRERWSTGTLAARPSTPLATARLLLRSGASLLGSRARRFFGRRDPED